MISDVCLCGQLAGCPSVLHSKNLNIALITHTVLWLTSAICDSYLLFLSHFALVSHGKYARLEVILEEKFSVYLQAFHLKFHLPFV